MRIQGRCFVLAAFAVLSTGCASMPRPGTGDIAFRLYWQGEEDLDLHVQEPSGASIYFMTRKTESGGELDVDCNSAPDRICRSPIENVFWPLGKAADGDYTYWVELYEHPTPSRRSPSPSRCCWARRWCTPRRGSSARRCGRHRSTTLIFSGIPPGRRCPGGEGTKKPAEAGSAGRSSSDCWPPGSRLDRQADGVGLTPGTSVFKNDHRADDPSLCSKRHPSAGSRSRNCTCE
jgi:hypothetical protein